jgi:DegV family protein with EDD domain
MLARDLAAAGRSGAEVAAEVTERAKDVEAIVCLDTLEYLRRGGRISGAQAVIGTLLSVKPIIAIRNGKVEQVDRVRTRGKARTCAIEFVTARPIERLAVFHSISPDLDEFRAAVIARAGTVDAAAVETAVIGPSIGPHLGPGALGAAMLYREG